MGSAHDILLVEDNADQRITLSYLLNNKGFSVYSAGNGREALDYLHRAEPPGIILLDLRMPGMNGLQFLEQQRREATLASIPVVLLSGEVDLHKIAASFGTASYLQKPVEFEGLLEVIQVIASSRQQAAVSSGSHSQAPIRGSK
jgi:two-component system response regulator CpxR